jgi:hypothetical protein
MQTTQDLGIDPEDLGDVLLIIEKSFGFKFQDNELKHVKTYGDLCSAVIDKVSGTHVEDCTTQQSFYKLREAIPNVTDVEEELIKPNTPLELIFPKKNRRRKIKALQNKMGFKFSILEPPPFIITILLLGLVAGFVFLFIKPLFGICGLVGSILAFRIADMLGTNIRHDAATLKKLARKLTSEHYGKIRRTPGTINRDEIKQQIEYLFANYLGIEKEELVEDAVVV